MAEGEDYWDQYSVDSAIQNVIKNLSIHKTPKEELDSISEKTGAGRRVTYVVLPCGHQMPTDYVVAFFKYYLKERKTEFACPRFNENTKRTCGAKLSYHDICGLIPLTAEQREFLEENLAALAARRLCDFKSCPGCQSNVERQDQRNLCVKCTICTANKKQTYYFCWKCRREWKGPISNAVRCDNDGCGEKVITPDPLVQCKPEFKREKLKEEPDDIYPTKDKSTDRNRLALLINNVDFERSEDKRVGAEKDELSMEKLLTALGYTVVTLRDLSSQGMATAMRDFAKREEHAKSDSCFVVFMSHGDASGICGVFNCSSYRDIFSTDEIFKCLNTPNCAALRDKPKIILIQSCRGDNDGCVDSVDSVHDRAKEHIEKDFCCLRSCTPDTVSYRSEIKGSDFFQDIVEIFNQHAHRDHIEELFRKVLKKFKEKHQCQMPCKDRATLSKKFYLFPGL